MTPESSRTAHRRAPSFLLLSFLLLALFLFAAAHCGGPSHEAPPHPSPGPADATTADALADDGGPSDGSPGDADAWVPPVLGPIVDAGDPGDVDLTFVIHADQGARPISPYIYGTNNGNRAAPHHLPIVRNGGNRLTAYNWENNASNAGSDFRFQSDDYLCSTMGGTRNGFPCAPDSGTPGAYLRAVTDQAVEAGAAVALTVPIVDYVSADKAPPGDVRLDDAGAPVPDYLQTRFKKNHASKGGPFANPPDPTDDSVYQDEMVNWFAQTEPGVPVRFMLDNEPDLWGQTHPEVHPDGGATYAEVALRDVQFASAIKAIMPGALVWGPVSYGWQGYLDLQHASDRAFGNFLNWWLGQMSAAAQDAGKPLVDGMDLHWYSEVGDQGAITPADGGPPGSDCRITSDPMTNTKLAADCYTSDGIAGAAAAREQAPRSLWDPSYVENSWIVRTEGNRAVQLIPLMMGKIAAHDPGMRLSFSEWNYGGGGDMSGAIATADVLGIFGAYGVDMAMLWEVWHDESFTYAAFDAYRNYDDNGAAFGDTSIAATTTDVVDSSVYASVVNAQPSVVVVIAINKALTPMVAGIQIFHSTVYSSASVYTLTASGGPTLSTAPSISAVDTNAFAYTMPAQSVSVIVPSP